MGATAPYPLQLRGCHRDPRPHPAARPGGVRKHKKRRSRQLRPIYHRRMKTTKKDECSYSVSNAIRTLAMGCVDKKDTQQQRTIYCLLLLYLPTLEFEHGF